jgi:hypothetical protein
MYVHYDTDTQKIKQLIILLEAVSRLCRDWRLVPPIEVVIRCQGKIWRVDCSSPDSIAVSLPPPRAPFALQLTDSDGTIVEESVADPECAEASV